MVLINDDNDGIDGEGGENDEDDDVIFMEGIPKQKTGQMDLLTPFWATKSREVFLSDLWANQNVKYPVKQK